MVHEANRVIIEHEGREFVVKQTSGVFARRTVGGMPCGDGVMLCRAEVPVQTGDRVAGGVFVPAFLKEPRGI